MRLLITGGGTGGHVYPLLAVLQSLRENEQGADEQDEVLYVGRPDSIEERLAEKAGIRFEPIRVGGLRSLAPWTVGRNLFQMIDATRRSHQILDEFKPEAMLATGGYVSAPAIWAAAKERTPLVIYLPDLEPGWAIRFLSRWAWQVAVSFKEVQSHFPFGKSTVTGYPVRREFQNATRVGGRAHFHLDQSQPVLTIFGGSQGARSINEAVSECLTALLVRTQIIHVSGRGDYPALISRRDRLTEAEKARYLLFDYLDEEMPLALAAANLVIARSGAATLGEFPAVGVASILVPYPHAGKHQEKNADFLVSRGAAIKVNDAELKNKLLAMVTELVANPTLLEQMGGAARKLGQPTAASNIVELLKRARLSARNTA